MQADATKEAIGLQELVVRGNLFARSAAGDAAAKLKLSASVQTVHEAQAE